MAIETIYYAQPEYIWEMTQVDDKVTLKIISAFRSEDIKGSYTNNYIHIVEDKDYNAIVCDLGGCAARQRVLLALAFKPRERQW